MNNNTLGVVEDSSQCPPTHPLFINNESLSNVDTAMSKTCTKCRITKPFSEFSKSNPTKKDGHNSWCKECCREASKRHSSTPSGIYSTLKGSANFYKHTTMDMTREEFVEWHNSEPKHCAYCGISESDLDLIGNYYYEKCNRLTVDRMDNSMGYRIGNIVLSCYRCNMTKGDVFSFDEMVEIGHRYLMPKWKEEQT